MASRRSLGGAASLIGLLAWGSFAQAEPIPPWLADKIRERVGPDRALFEGRGEGKTQKQARDQAEANALAQACRCVETVVTNSGTSSTTTTYQGGEGDAQVRVEQETIARCRAALRGFTAIHVLDSIENDQPSARGFYTVPRDQLPEGCGSDPLTQDRTYFVWRSAIAPGWGQFEKDQNTKAWLIVIGEVATVSGAIVTAMASRAERDKAAETRFQSERDDHNLRADQLGNASLGFVVAAAAIYVFNVADAYGSSPERSTTSAYLAPAPVVGGAGLFLAAGF